MHYLILAPIFFISLFISIAAGLLYFLRPRFYIRYRKRLGIFLVLWFLPYFIFVFTMTGPSDLSKYPPREKSPYKLPWKSGVTRFVAQGNRSFTSHRDFHEFAWDFVMKNGTEILASRSGHVLTIDDGADGIGFHSNVIEIEHEDGQISAYAHIQHLGAIVKKGDFVQQGQVIALSGMVGQTIFPHVHFYVMNKEKTSSIPISFSEVLNGVPLAGHFYTSENELR